MPNMSYMARDSVHETKSATRDAGKAASAAAGDIQDDLLALRDNVGQADPAEDEGLEAVDAVRAVGENMSTHSTSRSRCGPTRLWGSRSGQDFCSPRRGGNSR